MSYELDCMKEEVEKMSRYVKPLTAITELTMTKKRVINSENMDEFLEESYQMTQEERAALLKDLNPDLVLQNLAEFCNSQILNEKQLK